MHRYPGLILFVVLLSVQRIAAQEAEGQKPTLNDHTFIPVNTLIKSAFSNTTVSMPIGVGSTANFDFPILEDIDTLGRVDGDLLFANLGFNYSQRIRDWIRVYIRANLAARLGTNIESILSQGFNTVIRVNMGSMIRLFRTQRTQLSMSVGVSNYNANIIDIRGFVKDVIESNPDPRIVRDVPALTAGGGLHFAWGINRTFGVRGESNLFYGETFTRGSSGIRYSITAVVDVDFNKRYKVPLGVAVIYSISNEPEIVYVDDRTARTFLVKIAYTGRKDFDFGIETGQSVIPLQNVEDKPQVISTSFTMNYFFN